MPKVDAVLVDSNSERRLKLRTAIAAVPDYGKIHQSRRANDCLLRLEEKQLDLLVVFISAELPQPEIEQLINAGKQTKAGIDSSYILVLHENQKNKAALAGQMLQGVDGFCLQPCSVENLQEITRLAHVTKKKRWQERMENTLRYMVREGLSNFDKVARKKANQQAPGEDWLALQDFGSTLRGLNSELFLLYESILIQEAEAAAAWTTPTQSPSSWLNPDGKFAPKLGRQAQSSDTAAEERLNKRLAALGLT